MDSSPILAWFQGDGARWFTEVAIADAEPGDALLVKVRRIPHHLAIFLPGQNLLHVTHERGVEIIRISPAWLRFTDRVFRPRL
jgi:cell wall-associated NlpC family hydrolase